ncbi:MAG: hypothetical protein AAGD10_11615 [Myxococcota bacterium]
MRPLLLFCAFAVVGVGLAILLVASPQPSPQVEAQTPQSEVRDEGEDPARSEEHADTTETEGVSPRRNGARSSSESPTGSSPEAGPALSGPRASAAVEGRHPGHHPPPRLEDLAPAVRAQVLELKRQGADPRLRTASDGSTFVELGGPAHFVPVATIDEDGEVTITEY